MKNQPLAGKKEVGLKEYCKIEELPDELLSSIISYLPVNEAARTSTLSRRWKSLYLSMRRLNFDGIIDMFVISDGYRRRCNELAYACYVDHFLKHYVDAKIESLRLAIPLSIWFPDDDISRWIRSAIQMGAEELDLTYLSHDRCGFSSGFPLDYKFSFQILSLPVPSKLKHLYLHYCCIAPVVSEPLHSLATLELDKVPVDETTLRCIFSSCVNLRKLLLRECNFPPNLSISRPNINLKCLKMFMPRVLQKIEVSAAELIIQLYSES